MLAEPIGYGSLAGDCVNIAEADLLIDPRVGALTRRPGSTASTELVELTRTLADLHGVFEDEVARATAAQDQVVYRVQSHQAVASGTEGGLFWGVTHVEPGLVGDEYFMTKGHFHARPECAEYYWGVQGRGVLLMMDRQRRCSAQYIVPGSLHFVPPHVAHRVANVGQTLLSVGACWPANAGHDYDEIQRHGFSQRLYRGKDGTPQLRAAQQSSEQ